MPKISFTLNGKPTTVPYEPGMHFLEVLREECSVVSPKNGCAPEGTCGCCAVLVDGRPVLSCLRKPEQMDGHDVVTVEGLPEEMRNVLGEAFVHEGGVQCGFCIPGIVVRAAGLIQEGCTGDREGVERRSTATCAAAPAMHGLLTQFKQPAKPGKTADLSRIRNLGVISTSVKGSG